MSGQHRPGRPSRPEASRHELDALEVRELAAELRALWMLMPAALPRDSIGLLTEGRGGGGGVGSPSPANTAVIDATVLVETGVSDIAAQATRLLHVPMPTSTLLVLGEVATWWHRLEQLQQPLAGHLLADLRAWTRAAQSAVGTRARDTVMDELCPEHRDTDPTKLRHLGATAMIAQSLLDGPPPRWRATIGPQCTRPAWQMCPHESCARIRERRHVDGPRLVVQGPVCRSCVHESCAAVRVRTWVLGHAAPPAVGGRRRHRTSSVTWSDWILTASGEPRWSPCPKSWPPEPQPKKGNLAFTWRVARTIRCPHCRQTWTSTEERRQLAKQLAALGDAAPDTAALIT